MNKPLTTLLAAGAVALGAAAPAGAAAYDPALAHPSDPAFLVPAGQIEHSITTVKVSGSNAIPSHTRTETWLSRTRVRTLTKDVRTGKVRGETIATPTEIRTYSAEDGVVRVEKRTPPIGKLPINSSAFEAAVQKAYVEQGITRVVGEKVVEGRRALVTESVAEKWRSDVAGSRTTAVVDAETFELYERSTVHPSGEFSQVATHSSELLAATPTTIRAALSMKKRKGVKIRRR